MFTRAHTKATRTVTCIGGAAILATTIWAVVSLTTARHQSPVTTSIDSTIVGSLSEKRVLFAHRSVGRDILQGIRALGTEAPQINLPAIKGVDDRGAITAPGIYDVAIGKNGIPATKFADFEDLLIHRGMGAKFDIAVLKLCFVDVKGDTDTEAVLREYTEMVARIREACPNLTLVHCTVPLRIQNEGFRGWLRSLIKGNENNEARSRYNKSIRDRFAAEAPMFDVAALESTHEDGRVESHTRNGAEYFSLCTEYSADGGHLNERGKLRLAHGFLAALASAAASPPSL